MNALNCFLPKGKRAFARCSSIGTASASLGSLHSIWKRISGSSPTLTWVDDSSEDQYDVTVLDMLGNVVWTHTMPGVNGGDASVDYAGPLEPGTFYQFRVVSSRQPGGGDRCNIAQTEDLKGVFFTTPP